MPKVKDFYQRIELLDECFRQHGKKWAMKQLLERVNEKLEERFEEPVSKRTLHYALKYLIDEKQAPVAKCKDGARVLYYYADANYSIKNLPLSDEEIVLLKDAVEVIKQVGSTSIARNVLSVIAKLEHSIADNSASDRMIIQFETQATATGIEHLDNLFTAIKEKIALHITYQPFAKEPYEQTVLPYLLKEYRNRWFLIARNNENNMLSTLALDRIKSVKTAKAAYKENDLFDPFTYFNNLIGVTFPAGEEVSNVVLKVKSNQAPYIKTKPIHFTQETEALAEGSMLVRLKLINNYELRSMLLSYGADIEVMEPSPLRKQIKQILEDGLSVYSIVQGKT